MTGRPNLTHEATLLRDHDRASRDQATDRLLSVSVAGELAHLTFYRVNDLDKPMGFWELNQEAEIAVNASVLYEALGTAMREDDRDLMTHGQRPGADPDGRVHHRTGPAALRERA